MLRGDATPLGVAHAALGQAAGQANVARVEREFFDLFIGLGRGELLPYGSYYLTGFLHERPLARLRADLAPLGIERAEGNCEPEDHAAILVRDHGGPARAAGCRRRPAPISRFSKSIWRRGSAASSPISSAPKRPISIVMSARSDACSSTSRRKPLRCRRETARDMGTQGGNAMKANDNKTQGRPSRLPSRARRRRRRSRDRRGAARHRAPKPTPKPTMKSARPATRKPIT